MPVLSTVGAMAARGFGWLFKAAGGGTAGSLYAWGYNGFGQLGQGNTTDVYSPVQVGSSTSWTDASIASHVMAIQSNGSLWAWGYNAIGRLGDGTTVNKSSPVQIGSLTNWASAQAKIYSTLALKTDGTLWSWGGGTNGTLGNGATTNISSPVQIGAGTSWTKIGYGSQSTYNGHAIRSDNTLWAWGYGNPSFVDATGYTVLNEPYPTVNQTTYSSPVQVSSAISWSAVSTGQDHALALTTGGALYAWGVNSFGQCGKSDLNNPYYYVVYPDASDCGGGGPAQFYRRYDSYVDLGNYPNLNNSGSCESPIDGVTATVVQATANTLKWGFSSPVQVGSDTNWAQVSAGVLYSGAIKTNGTLWMWGSNSFGALGTGDANGRSSPTQIGALTTWAYVKTGSYHNLAIKTDGTLWSWGYNADGQLGIGNNSSRSSPVQVGSATNWLKAIDALDAGDDSSIAIRS
jgi:alpha-tubulin suppressor-like RCC1 family protein